jgi:GMP synthase PP-ATPase subunit
VQFHPELMHTPDGAKLLRGVDSSVVAVLLHEAIGDWLQ